MDEHLESSDAMFDCLDLVTTGTTGWIYTHSLPVLRKSDGQPIPLMLAFQKMPCSREKLVKINKIKRRRRQTE